MCHAARGWCGYRDKLPHVVSSSQESGEFGILDPKGDPLVGGCEAKQGSGGVADRVGGTTLSRLLLLTFENLTQKCKLTTRNFCGQVA